MEKIVEIIEFEETGIVGFKIKTDEQVIKMHISNYQSCCENYGYFMSNDSIDDFIGSNLISISITDTSLNEAKLKEHDVNIDGKYFEGGVMFVNLETDRGTLQFVAYNDHNGYYGHEAVVESLQLNHEEVL